MAVSDTGSSLLPDIGTLSYNGVTFSNLYTSKISGEAVLDSSGRTIKYMRYTLFVDATVTLRDDYQELTIDIPMGIIRKKLDAPAGVLSYTDKGFGRTLVINHPGGTIFDVAWGPIPKTIEFIPLGGSRAAKVKWTVTFTIPEIDRLGIIIPIMRVLEFTNSTTTGFDEDGFSFISIEGTLEIPLTRKTQQDKVLDMTVDTARQVFISRISNDFDLTRFKVTKRDFRISADKRIMNWSFSLEELPYMSPPAWMLTAHGNFTCRPMGQTKYLQGNVRWVCTLRGTYTVPNGYQRRYAYQAFVALWAWRMNQSENAVIAPGSDVPAQPNPQNLVLAGNAIIPLAGNALQFANSILQIIRIRPQTANTVIKCLPISFSFDEGIYLDSKTVTFEASWMLMTTLQAIFAASGIWQKTGFEDANNWSTSVRNISGPSSWLGNSLDPAGQAIVDFGN